MSSRISRSPGTLVLCLSFVLPMSAAANLAPHAGAETWGSVSDLRVGGGQDNGTFAFHGGVGTNASAFLVDDAVETDFFGNGPHNRGLAQAAVTLLTGAPTVPQPQILRAKSVLTGITSGRPDIVGAGANASARAVQRYRYTGGAPLQLTFNLTATVHDPNPPQYSDQTWVVANVSLWATPNFMYGDTWSQFEFGATPLPLVGGGDAFDAGTTLTVYDDTGGSPVLKSRIFDVNVPPGTEFYLLQELYTSAREGDRVADGFSTLTAAVTGGNVFVVVPEPMTAGLLALAGALLLGRLGRPL